MGKKTESKEKEFSIGYLIPLIFVVVLLPLLVRQHKYNVSLVKYDWFQGRSSTSDLFLYIKMLWFNIVTITILCFMVFMFFSEEMKPAWDKMLIPIFLYGLLALLSAFVSVDKHCSFAGSYEQFESVWSLLGYVIVLYYAYFVLQNKGAVEKFLPCLVVGITLLVIFGLFQAAGQDPMSFEFLQKLFLTDKTIVGKLKFPFEKGRVYATLYNPNYVGSYAVLVFPVLIALVLHGQKLWMRIFCAVLAGALVFILYASQSRAGIVVLIVTFFLMLLCMRKTFMGNLKLIGAMLAVAVIGFIAVDFLSHNMLTSRMRSMFHIEKQEYALEDIETGKDVTFYYQGEEAHFTLDRSSEEAEMHIVDGKGAAVAYEQAEDGTYSITDPRFPFQFGVDQSEGFRGFHVITPRVINGSNPDNFVRTWYFSNQLKPGDSDYYVRASGQAFFKMKRHASDSKFLAHYFQIANNRGYLWARTIPLLKKYFFLGSGPDTFVTAFSNDDLVGMMNGGHDNQVITRPHCMYLQIATQTGVLSLIAFLVFYGWYLISSIRIYWNEKYESLLSKAGVAVMMGVLGYLMVSLTNDSMIVAAPVFFVLTGMGMGINHRLKKEKKELA